MDPIDAQTAPHKDHQLALAKMPSVAGAEALPLHNQPLALPAENNAWAITAHRDQAIQAQAFVPPATQALAAALKQRFDECGREVNIQINNYRQVSQAYIHELFEYRDNPNCQEEVKLKQALQMQQNILIQAREQWLIAAQHHQQAVNGFASSNQPFKRENLQPSDRHEVDWEELPTSAKSEPYETLSLDPEAPTALTDEISNPRMDCVNHATKENSIRDEQDFSTSLSVMQEYLPPDQNTNQPMVSPSKLMLTVQQAQIVTEQAQTDEKVQQTHTNLIRDFYIKAIQAFAQASTAQLSNIVNPQKHAATDEMVRQTLLPLGTLKKNYQQEVLYCAQCKLATRAAEEQLKQAKTSEREQVRYRNSTVTLSSTQPAGLSSPAPSITRAMSGTLPLPAAVTYQPMLLMDPSDFRKPQ